MRKLGLFALTLFLSSCGSSPDPLFCESPADCVDNAPATFCDIDKAFPGTELKNECIVPPSATACNRVQGCTDGLVCSDIAEGAAGECVECTAANTDGCGTGEICNTTNNQCEAQPCVVGTDGDAICAAAAPTKPFCVEADTCGQCRPAMGDCDAMAANAQVCDTENFNCRGCEANLECNSLICNVDTTSCALEADILYVGATPNGNSPVNNDDCDLANPCLEIQHAITRVMNATRNTIVVAAGAYPEKLLVDGKPVSIIGQGEVTVNPPLPLATDFALVTTNSAVVNLSGIIVSRGTAHDDSGLISCNGSELNFSNSTITNSNTAGIASTNCILTVNQSTVSGNDGIGVSSSGGTLTINQSTVSENPGGGVNVNDSNYTIVNNFIVENGTLGNSAIGGVSVSSTNDKLEVLRFNTFADNTSGAPAHALNCIASALVADSNIFMLADAIGNTPTVTGCGATYSLFDTDSMMIVGQNNISANADFVDAANDDYHLQSGSPGTNVASMIDTPVVDVDGDVRPQGVGPDMGADEAE